MGNLLHSECRLTFVPGYDVNLCGGSQPSEFGVLLDSA
jgi:hypothetical protein